MKTFLREVAEALYNRYGDEISSLNILFPSKRARLFFDEALSAIVHKPIWQPHYTTIDEMAGEISGLQVSDPIRLVTELYKIYCVYHQESFDSFYFWGETLLSDFDSVDKYMIDADMLFANISDLKTIEGDLSYITPEQREVISRFWETFGHEESFSEEKKRFMAIWMTLGPIYNKFREVLSQNAMSYPGMMYREAAERIKSGRIAADGKHYAVAGFNALSESEKIIFDHLAKENADFFWDYDRYYLDKNEQEAGLFLRENIVRYPQKIEIPCSGDSFSAHKRITVASAPSNSMQAKYVGHYLAGLSEQGSTSGKETAIVLTDESLLLPVLYSIPPEVDQINVTMGYPLRQTLAYSFAERLIQLQTRKRRRGAKTTFHHQDVRGLLLHPYVARASGDTARILSNEIVERQQVHIESAKLSREGLIGIIFRPVDEGFKPLYEYLTGVLAAVAASGSDAGGEEAAEKLDFLYVISENIVKVANSVEGCGIEISEKVFASLLRRVLQSISVPYEGEPLQGVQVMGILETRNLDFENVVVLSVNDDNFPGNRASSPSFIPYNLRMAYGLPTPEHHEGVYAYYFYRLLQRAKNVHLVYSSKSDEKSNGEPSRFIYQLDYESAHEIEHIYVGNEVNMSLPQPITVGKDDTVMERLSAFTEKGSRVLSPTSFFNFIQCPLKFYFHSVSGISAENEIEEDIDAPMFGNILHKSMELLYRPLVGKPAPQDAIKALAGSADVDTAVRKAVMGEYLKGADVPEEEWGGNIILIKDIVTRYINRCILPFDVGRTGYTVCELEKRITHFFGFTTDDGSGLKVRFGGYADRIDLLADGYLRVVDYKTGSDHREFKSIEKLFSPAKGDNNSAVLQTMLYSMMLSGESGKDVRPELYFVRKMGIEGYSPLLAGKEDKADITSYRDNKDIFEENLSAALRDLFDRRQPFTQCDDPYPCRYCDFNKICNR